MVDEVRERQIEAAHKAAYITKINPDLDLAGILDKLKLPSIDLNCSLWLAQELDLIGESDKETGRVEFLHDPEDGWKFGTGVERIRRQLVYALEQLAKKESDLTVEEVDGWCQGYAQHDIDIALATLVEERVIGTYDLTDPKDLKSTYTFYTLYENTEQMWGKTRFKVQPTGEEVPDNTTDDSDMETISDEEIAESENK